MGRIRGSNHLQIVEDRGIRILAIIDMAKNAGKTVMLNTLIRESQQSARRIAVASYDAMVRILTPLPLKRSRISTFLLIPVLLLPATF